MSLHQFLLSDLFYGSILSWGKPTERKVFAWLQCWHYL